MRCGWVLDISLTSIRHTAKRWQFLLVVMLVHFIVESILLSFMDPLGTSTWQSEPRYETIAVDFVCTQAEFPISVQGINKDFIPIYLITEI